MVMRRILGTTLLLPALLLAAAYAGRGADASFVPEPAPSPRRECCAPVTTVALAAVPQDGGE